MSEQDGEFSYWANAKQEGGVAEDCPGIELVNLL